ncbi:nidogen-2 [Anoplophora glabripennis]|uniref:nidogen-2 n=1 Tax=Anoplophora glabripennis TaxID=217634 RepID=UPI000874519F|nr:nidogen-2 [Anoplophora glabripennis]
MRLIIWCFLCFCCANVRCIPVSLLYDHNFPEVVYLSKEDDFSSPEIRLREPVVFFGIPFETIYVNSNGLLSFQTEIPQFINIQFPLDYPIIAPFYSNVDTRKAGTISYYETDKPSLLQRATENVHEAYINSADFQATSLFIVTWDGVGYYKEGEDKVNTYQVVIITDGVETYVEFLYPENGLQWIQGTGDRSGLPDARAQAGIISPDGKLFTLPGSGTEKVRNLDRWSNIGLEGQFIYKVDESDIREPDTEFDKQPSATPTSCSEAASYCHVQAKCIDYEDGFCCECNPRYYGNGKYCIIKDVPLRVNGKIHGKINEEKLEGFDLQSYISMADGRAYTAISRIPESIGFDVQSLQILGSVIGYLFAKPVKNALNGYQLTGGVFNHSTVLTFLNTSQVIRIKQKYLGLDVFDQLRLEADIQGEIPNLPHGSKVIIDEYQEQYSYTNPGVIQMTSQRSFRYVTPTNEEYIQLYTVDQTFVFDYCKFENKSVGESWKLKVGKNFISYETREQIVRYGLSNKITPLGDYDPCEEGRSQCTANSACVVENDSFRCVCSPGYQNFYSGSETVCADINECQTGQHECDYNAQCVNVVGSYSCQCNPGYEGTGFVCENARSCVNITCNENAECVENNDVAACRCQPGFSGDGQYCTPKAGHSCHEANNCSPFGYCYINPDNNNYYCACLPGYAGDGYNCVQVETTTGNFPEITTTISSVRKEPQTCSGEICYCPEGYKVEVGTNYCTPTEEVTYPVEITTLPETEATCDVVNNCHRDASCLFSDHLKEYACVCNDGFEGDGYICEVEYVSCTKVNNCDQHATCTYDENLGRSKCVCNPGFEGDGYNCSVSATCRSDEECPAPEMCAYNTASGRYECSCKDGYVRDSQHQCVIVGGSCGGGTCVENAECVFDEIYQTFYCACKPGYVGDGITECREKVVGCDTLNNCGTHATCQYLEEALSYKCLCKEGFFGDGINCYAERNCHVDPSMCDPHAVCLTDANRRYICQCSGGYVGNGTVCREISRHEGNFLLVNKGMATLKIPLEPTKTLTKKAVQVKGYQTAVGLDVDCMEGRIYWSDITGRAIRSALFDGSKKEDFIKDAIGSPEGLAVDWVSRNIYWTDSTNDTIEVANLDSKLRRTLFNTDLVNPRGIAVHPQRGKIFWTDWDRKNPKIEWANADGTDRQIFLRGDSVLLPNSLTIDYDTEQLCYADAGSKKIECVQIDNKVKQTIAVNCTYPFGVAVTDKHVYWSDWISKKIEGVDKYTLKRVPPLQVPLEGSGNKLYGLVAVANSCPSLTNVCQYYKNQCPPEHICLPNGLGTKRCLCAYRSDALNERPSCVL